MSKQILSWVSADPERFYSLKGTGFSDKFEFRRSQSADNAAFLLALKTGLSGLPAYNGRTVTVTGSFPNAVTVEFSGSTDAVMLVPDGGVTDSFTVAGGAGNYTVNAAAPVTLGVAEGALQTNQRALGGQFAGVIAKGSSAANTGPGQIDSFSGSGPFPSVNGKTPAAALANSEAIRADFEAQIRTLAGRGGAVVAGTFTKATAPTGYRVSGAGDASYNGDYVRVSSTLFKLDDSHYLQLNPVNANRWDFASFIQTAQGYSGYYVNSSGTSAAPPSAGWTDNGSGTTPPSLVSPLGVAPSSINATITYPASAGNVGAISVAGAGYTGTTTAPNPNGTADFKLYYPTGAAPVAPGVTGTGAAIVRTFSASQVGLNVAVPGVDNYNYITAVTSGPIIKDTNAATNLGGTFTLQIASLDTAALGANPASFKSKIQHSDDGVTFTDLVSFDDLTTKTSSTKSVPKTTAIKPYVRFSVTACVGRWAPSVAFSRQP